VAFDKDKPWLTSEGEIARHFARDLIGEFERLNLFREDHPYLRRDILAKCIQDAHKTLTEFEKYNNSAKYAE
jgi:hypothetical protein